ncbi:hypothetical protein ACTFIY_001953 [Dictyostelium cf. discoideum]
MFRCNKIVNKLFKNEIILNNNSKILIRNMSILSQRQIFEKAQELRPTTKSNSRDHKKDSMNYKREQQREEDEKVEMLIENKKLEFEKMKELTQDNYNNNNINNNNNNNNNKKPRLHLLGLDGFFNGNEEEDEEADSKINMLLEASNRGDKREVLRLGQQFFFNESLEDIKKEEEEELRENMRDPLKLFSPDNLASEYITRLLIEQYQNKNRSEDIAHAIIVRLPEWQDYNNEVLREVEKLELQEVSYKGPDSKRVTQYWNVKRIKLVDSIRRKHSKRVGEAVAKEFKRISREMQKEIDEDDIELQKKTGLTLDQLKQHKDYAHLYSEDDEDEYFEENEYDKLVKTLVGSDVDNIPKQVREIFYTTTKSIEASKEKDRLLFEKAEIETKRQNEEKQQPQYQYQYQQKPQQSNSIIKEKAMSFGDIVAKNQLQQKQQQQLLQQQQKQQQQQGHMDADDFDLKSILNSMSEKKLK